MRKILHFIETVLPITFWVLIMFGFDSISVTVMTLLAAIIHECGHLAVISHLCGHSSAAPAPRLDGMRITPSRILSYKEEIFAAFGGPLANAILFLILIPFFDKADGYAVTFATINLMTALSNLLPVSGFDGYKIALNALALKFGSEGAERFLSAFSFLFCTVILFLSLYLILKIGEGYWIFGIFFIATLGEVFKRSKPTKTKNVRDFGRV